MKVSFFNPGVMPIEKHSGENVFFCRQVFANLRGAGTLSSGGFATRFGRNGRDGMGGNFGQGLV